MSPIRYNGKKHDFLGARFIYDTDTVHGVPKTWEFSEYF